MSMTRKDYEAIAEVLALYSEDEAAGHVVRKVSYLLAKHFAGDNARFDAARFLIAAGVIGGTI